MTEITLYAPRKITPQNRKSLPQSHDPAKRTTYVLITLEENEIQEAIRNYIRAQLPVNPDDELPISMIAGRGDNGHSATVTVQAGKVQVSSPSRPTEALATFTEVSNTAAARNDEETPEPAQVTKLSPAVPNANKGPNPNKLPAPENSISDEEAFAATLTLVTVETIETVAVESVCTEEAPIVKKSSLFAAPAPQPIPEAVGGVDNSEPVKPKAKSIFDGL